MGSGVDDRTTYLRHDVVDEGSLLQDSLKYSEVVTRVKVRFMP